MRQIVLASTSQHRRAVLERLGLPFNALAPLCDETGVDHLPAEERAVHLAVRKAMSLAERFPRALIIGSDQIPEVDGVTLSKPGNSKKARESLRMLAGKEHRLFTGLALVEGGEGGRVVTALDESRLRMRPLSDKEIANYVKREHVMNCAGSYRAEGLGAVLFEKIDTDDPTAVIGLPLTLLFDLFARLDFHVLR
jgi:septum formation protein